MFIEVVTTEKRTHNLFFALLVSTGFFLYFLQIVFLSHLFSLYLVLLQRYSWNAFLYSYLSPVQFNTNRRFDDCRSQSGNEQIKWRFFTIEKNALHILLVAVYTQEMYFSKKSLN